jgi:hypothetical protein
MSRHITSVIFCPRELLLNITRASNGCRGYVILNLETKANTSKSKSWSWSWSFTHYIGELYEAEGLDFQVYSATLVRRIFLIFHSLRRCFEFWYLYNSCSNLATEKKQIFLEESIGPNKLLSNGGHFRS